MVISAVSKVAGAAEKASSFFEGASYTPKVLQQMQGGVGEFHSFPESVTAFESAGTVRTVTGGDNVVRQVLELPGSYGSGEKGVFQFIKDSDWHDQSPSIRPQVTMTPETEYRSLLESRGIPLQSLGIAETGLNRNDAILAVSLLRSASIAILGGDVYFRTPAGIETAYANWHSSSKRAEDRESFVARSGMETLSYIESFPTTEATPIFVLVTDF